MELEFGREEDKDSGGLGSGTSKGDPSLLLCGSFGLLSPAQSAGVTSGSLCCATASCLRTLQNSEEDVKPQSH